MYTPTKEELEWLENNIVKVYMLDHTNKTPTGLIEVNWAYIGFAEWESIFLWKWRKWTIVCKWNDIEVFPQSLEDIKTIIRILTPQ